MGKDLIEIYGHAPSDLSGEYVADKAVKVVYGFRYCFEHLRKWREYTLKVALQRIDFYLGLSKSIEENPRELYFKVGIIGPTQARITL